MCPPYTCSSPLRKKQTDIDKINPKYWETDYDQLNLIQQGHLHHRHSSKNEITAPQLKKRPHEEAITSNSEYCA